MEGGEGNIDALGWASIVRCFMDGFVWVVGRATCSYLIEIVKKFWK